MYEEEVDYTLSSQDEIKVYDSEFESSSSESASS